MPEQLLVAVNELVNVVRSLERTLKQDYPKREELKQRGRNMVFFVVLAIVASYFFTVGTISVCFLSAGSRSGHALFICGALPGYGAAQIQNKQLLGEFEKLLKQTDQNKKKIKRLEERLQ